MTRQGNATTIPVDVGRIVQAAFECDECSRWSIGSSLQQDALGRYDSYPDDFIDVAQEIYWLPQRASGKDFPDVPEHIAAAASEAHQCRSINANRASTLLARAVIEATAKDQGVVKGTLEAKIDALQTEGFIREHVAEAAHEARHLGNDMAHGDFATVAIIETDDADDVLTIMDDILLEVYQSPAKTKSLRDRRKARKSGEQSSP